MQDYNKLDVFKKADDLVVLIYVITKSFPPEEKFGLSAHLRKTAMSIPSNIAEGCGRQGQRELFNFLNIAQGSAKELDYQLHLASRLLYIQDSTYNQANEIVKDIQRMLTALMRSVSGKSLDAS